MMIYIYIYNHHHHYPAYKKKRNNSYVTPRRNLNSKYLSAHTLATFRKLNAPDECKGRT